MIQTLSNCIKESSFEAELMGHIGGDDFVLVFHKWEIKNICEQIIELFDQTIKDLYSDSDWKNGYILSRNRNGVEERFPIASLSITVITNQNKNFKTMNEFSKTIAEFKKVSKQIEGNSIIET